jgi:citrate lyase subunit beta/citryl-CoA lyase
VGSRHYNYAKVKRITAARAAGITVVHGVTLAVSDHEACRRVAQMGARMGFDGKWAIHPAQFVRNHKAYTLRLRRLQERITSSRSTRDEMSRVR